MTDPILQLTTGVVTFGGLPKVTRTQVRNQLLSPGWMISELTIQDLLSFHGILWTPHDSPLCSNAYLLRVTHTDGWCSPLPEVIPRYMQGKSLLLPFKSPTNLIAPVCVFVPRGSELRE